MSRLKSYEFMKIEVNGNEFDVVEHITVENLIKELKLDVKSTAVAVNKSIVARSSYKDFSLKENDAVDLVTIAPGG